MDAATARGDARTPLQGAVILFDLDGTLVDTAPDLVAALNAALAEIGLPPCPLSDVRAMVGRGSRAMIYRGLARVGTALPEPAITALQRRFLTAYRGAIAVESRIYPGVEAALDALSADGAELAVATNKPDDLAHALLRALALEHRFARVVGATRAPRRKPDAAHLRAAAGEAGVARAVMIGDSPVDAAAARAAGVPIILLRHGYSETPVDTLGADAVIDGFDQVPAAVALALARQRQPGPTNAR